MDNSQTFSNFTLRNLSYINLHKLVRFPVQKKNKKFQGIILSSLVLFALLDHYLVFKGLLELRYL